MADWFDEHAPKASAAAGGDWFSQHAPGATPEVAKESGWARGVRAFGENVNPLGEPTPGEGFETRLGKIAGGIADIPRNMWGSLTKSGEAMTHGDIPGATFHLAGAVPVLGPMAQQFTEDIAGGKAPEAIGHGLGIGAMGLAARGEAPAIPESVRRFGTATKAGLRAATPDVAAGAGSISAGMAGSAAMHHMGLPGSYLPTVIASYPGARMIGRGIKTGLEAGREAFANSAPAAAKPLMERANLPEWMEHPISEVPPQPPVVPIPSELPGPRRVPTAAERLARAETPTAAPAPIAKPSQTPALPVQQYPLPKGVHYTPAAEAPAAPPTAEAPPSVAKAPPPAESPAPAPLARSSAAKPLGRPDPTEVAQALNQELFGTRAKVDLPPDEGWPKPEVFATAQRPFKAMNLAHPLHEAGIAADDIARATPEQLKPFVRAIGQNETGDISPTTIQMVAEQMRQLEAKQASRAPAEAPAPLVKAAKPPAVPVEQDLTGTLQASIDAMKAKQPAPEPLAAIQAAPHFSEGVPVNLVELRAKAPDPAAFDQSVLKAADAGDLYLTTPDHVTPETAGGFVHDPKTGKYYVAAQQREAATPAPAPIAKPQRGLPKKTGASSTAKGNKPK